MIFRAISLFFMLAAIPLMAGEPDWHVRRGLPHVEARSRAGGTLRVAYLGGSITAADGWRPLFTTHLRQLWPQLTIEEINAGLPGTGSDLGAFRVGRDVLRHRPDLVLVEFAVNDASTPPEQIERTMEGIVRQVRRAEPAADLCFVYTISTPGLPDITAGRLNRSARAMERVADHYGIPTIAFGFEVARRVQAGEFIFKGTLQDGEKAFSLDGVHPTPVGHRLYVDVLRRALPELLRAPVESRSVPAPMHADNWERAALREVTGEMMRGDWQPVALDDDNLRGATKALLPPTWRTATPGAAIEFDFTGTRFGLLGIAAPDSGEFIVRVDGGEPVVGTFFDFYATPSFCRQRTWFYPHTLSAGTHRVRVELSANPVDKAEIKSKAGRPMEPVEAYAPQRLTICALLPIDLSLP